MIIMKNKLREDLKRYNAMREHAFVNYLSAYKNNESSDTVDRLENEVNEFDNLISSLELILKRYWQPVVYVV